MKNFENFKQFLISMGVQINVIEDTKMVKNDVEFYRKMDDEIPEGIDKIIIVGTTSFCFRNNGSEFVGHRWVDDGYSGWVPRKDDK